MIRSKGEAGTGDVVEAVRHMRSIRRGIAELEALAPEELHAAAKDLRAPYELVRPAWPSLAACPWSCSRAGGIATPGRRGADDAARRRRLFVGSGIFKSDDPAPRARAIVEAITHFRGPRAARQGLRGARRADGRHRARQARRRRAAGQARLVSAGAQSACSRCRARSASTSRCCARLGADAVEVRTPDELERLDGLVLPGGESTTIGKLLVSPASTAAARAARGSRSSARARG